MKEKWSFLSSFPGACLGNGELGRVSMSAGHLEPVQESTSRKAKGPWQLRRQAAGDLGKRRLLYPQLGPLQRSNCPWYFPFRSHMKSLVGKREGTHTAEEGVKTWDRQTEGRPREEGNTEALGYLETLERPKHDHREKEPMGKRGQRQLWAQPAFHLEDPLHTVS